MIVDGIKFSGEYELGYKKALDFVSALVCESRYSNDYDDDWKEICNDAYRYILTQIQKHEKEIQ